MVFGEFSELEITEENYYEIKISLNALSAARSIEEKYDVLIENYIQLEQDISAICARSMIRRVRGYSDIADIIRKLNVRVSTLLSAAKMYTDHLYFDITAISKVEKTSEKFVKKLIKKRRDEDRYFRLVEGIRNYSQHCSMPVSSITLGGQWHEAGDKAKGTCGYTMKIYTSKNDLSGIRELRKNTLGEFDEQIDLKFALGRYFSALGDIHIQTREHIEQSIDECRSTVEEWMKKYSQFMDSQQLLDISAIRVENNKIEEEVHVHLNWDDVRRSLVDQNKGLSDLSVRYISTISETAQSLQQ